jgi:ATP-dependent exoDNAse (exonuclease V) beta subunit
VTAPRLPDEAARERVRTRVDLNFLVEAGAGTGKTRLLVDRVENLIATGAARMRDVVAITFTETAAADLRVQIRQRVEAAMRRAEGEAGERFRTALEDLEIAHVSTIHAFAAELLRERPVEAGIDPGFAVADELSASLLRAEAWDRWLEQQKDDAKGPLRDAVEHGLSLRQLRVVGDELLRYRDVLTGDMDRGPRPRDPLEWLRAAEPHLRGCIARIARDCREQSDRAADDLRALGQELDVLTRLPEIEVRRAVLSEFNAKVRGRQGNWAPGALQEIRQRLGGLMDELQGLRAGHAHWLAAGVANALRGYFEVYRALKAAQGVLDFDDLLLFARNLLRDNLEVRRYYQHRFAAILVDEFQDTDPLQAEIVFFLAEADPRASAWDQVALRPGKLFIVGDPKQSIYAFRRADIETYERVKDVLGRSGKIEYITANFRSVQEILDAVNATFDGVMRPPADGRYQPDYVRLEASTRTRQAGDAPVLALLYPDPESNDDLDVSSLREVEAEALAAFLQRQIESAGWKVGPERRPASYGDVALLFRGMSDVPIYEEALARYEIPYRVTSSRTFYKREEVGWLLNVLHAVEHPTDAVAVWGALRSPLLGCSDREVYAHVSAGGSFDYRAPAPAGADSIASAFGVLRALHADRNLLSVPRLVEEVLSRTQAMVIFLLTPQGEQRVANLSKVVTLARALEESGPMTLRAFVRWLRDMEETAVDEAESPTVEEGDNVVRIMSIHAAKGLEFPVVVVPDLGRGPGGGPRHLLLQRVRGAVGVYVGKVANAWPIQTLNYETLKAEQERREDAERLRLLYVAMTRAKDALVLPVFPHPAKNSMMEDLQHVLPEKPKLGKQHNSWLMVDGSKIPRIAGDPIGVRLRLPDAPTLAGDVVKQDRSAWIDAKDARLKSCGTHDRVQNPSALVDKAELAALKRAGARLESDRGGRELGNLVHAVLATIPFDRLDLIPHLVWYFAAQRRLSEKMARKAEALVQGALSSVVIREALKARSWREVPFTVAEGEQILEGAIDLLVQEAEKMNVIDFKTDLVSPSARAALETLYGAQIEKYVAVVQRSKAGEVSSRLSFLESPGS